MRALAALAVIGLSGVAAPSRAGDFDPRQTFATKCAMCHGKTGAPAAIYAQKGVRALNDAEWQKSRSDAELHKTIAEGKKGTLMAGFKQAFSEDEIDALVKYIRSLAPTNP